ncbi:type I-E CRISPR-associated protein Cse1/CasA [Apilactobacillus xinyiensis]|uniref:type I-E CRISPR-associated protein Cse1/CasA n=1 Tax=Apilactobacillus xinyiensis TaxID=2841032 RepID=UPI001C7CC437|nr:type I-E CRISPR-associated protein Cse1/CasA [Apilactobacillus xinyiensis]
MSRYNLLYEPWLKVIDNNNELQKVSLLQIFENAHTYKRLAGDTSVQDFAILRLLLSILQTTFSRVDVDGNPRHDENDEIIIDWKKMWDNQKFAFTPINDYLVSQENKFYLFDDQYPFYQVSKNDLESANIKKTGSISGKLINRLISESNNKDELFVITDNKNHLTNDALAKWIIMFMNYTGTSDKAKFPGMTASASKGWNLGMGSIYLGGMNLFQTLMLNFVVTKKAASQKPVWEMTFAEKSRINSNYTPSNLSELYTNCSRLIFIDPDTDLEKHDVDIEAVQLPGIDINNSKAIEPMTLFQVPKSGKNKGNTIPRPHNPNKSLWRNFGLLASVLDKSSEHLQLPGVMNNFYSSLSKYVDDKQNITITAVGMTYNHDASSMPNGEVYDVLNINKDVLSDVVTDGLVAQINEEVAKTEKAVNTFRYFVLNVMNIRNSSNNGLVDRMVEEVYFAIDEPFKYWLGHIDADTDMGRYTGQWNRQLYRILVAKAQELMHPLSDRDLLGAINEKTNSVENIITRYSALTGSLRKQLNIK